MPVNTNFNIPFIPQEGITSQILSAIQLANEQKYRQQQLSLQQQGLGIEQQRADIGQQQANTQQQLGVAQIADLQQQAQLRQAELERYRQGAAYVFGVPDQSAGAGPQQQKSGLLADAANIRSQLKLSGDEPAGFDTAVRQVQTKFLSKGEIDMSPVDSFIKDHLDRQGKKDTTLHPTFRQMGNKWFQDMHTADGQLAYSVPVPPPAEYLSHATEGVDYMRTVDQNTGQVTITPIETHRTTTPIMPGQPGAPAASKAAPPAASPAASKPTPTAGNSFVLPGGGKKLSEAGQSLVTGLSNAMDLSGPAMDFLKNPPSYVDWQMARLKYKAGIDPGPGYSNAFQAVGLLRAVATGPLLHGIRNAEIIRGIQDHLPSDGDSPALIAQKLKDLQPFWKRAIQEVYKTENVKQPGASQAAPSVSPADEASGYLQSLGIK